MVRVRARTPAAQAAPPPSPTPDTGVAAAPEQVSAAAYPQGVQVPVIVNNFINVVGDEAGMAQERREFRIRQREPRQGVLAPKGAQRDASAVTGSQQEAPDSPRTARHKRIVGNWADLAQAGFFRIVQRWRCRDRSAGRHT